jgi:hypothetical protein
MKTALARLLLLMWASASLSDLEMGPEWASGPALVRA